MTIIRTFSDGSYLSFDNGAFDNWRVYLKRPNQLRYAPTDLQYFSQFQKLVYTHGHQKIYDDIVAFYLLTSKVIDQQVLLLISQLSGNYQNNALEMEILFAITYAGMIAEENKQSAILKKRIKRLGMHQILIEKLSPAVAANFSRGKKWHELDKICTTFGF